MRKIIALCIILIGMGTGVCLAQTRTLTGTITDKADKSPLPGVTVMLKGTTTGTATDIDGKYSIPVKDGDILVISFIGMVTQEIPVKGQKHLDVQLAADNQMLEEVVAIGYGVRKKGSITGSVSTIKSDKLENTPVANFASALQGQAPGLQIFTNSGQPNSPASFTLRGVNSINAGSSPFFIIDGMQVSPQDFASYNPNDFESISVLKDASSTAIYGARATNGVVLITTKRGRMSERAKVTVRGQVGISNLAYGKWDMMNSREKLDYEEEIGIRIPGEYDRAELDAVDVDWRDVVFNNNAMLQNYELSVSGANEKTHYYVSAGFHDQEGITYKTYFRRYTTRLNLDTKANDWLKIGVNMTGAYEQSNSSYENEYASFTPLGGVRKMNPYWDPYKADGSLASMSDGSWKGTGENPLEYIDSEKEESNKVKFTGSLFAEITPIKNLTLKTLGGADFADGRDAMTKDPDYVPNKGDGSVTEGFARRYTLQITNTADYQFSVNDVHNLRFLLGQEASYYYGNGFGIRGTGITDRRLLQFGSATNFSQGYSSKVETTFLSFFGRAEYNYKEKYYIDATARRDGSSRFGSNTRWGTFWSTGAMWNVQRESFMEAVPFLTNTQLSVSIGQQGNSSIPDYAHLATVGNLQYGNNQGISPNKIGNPDLTWETTTTLNVGLRFGIFDRVRFSFDIYRKITTDMLMEVPFSLTSGSFNEWDNIGKMRNNGVDFDMNVDVLKTDGFLWNVSANFSYNKNTILALYEDNDEYALTQSGLKYKVGHSVGEFYVNRFAGVNPANGDALYYTKDGGITNKVSAADLVITKGKSYFAPWSGGFATSLSYKGFNLSAQFSWVGDRYMINNDRFFSESNGQFASENQSRKMLYDRWKKPGDIAKVPRHGAYMALTDDRLIENASFLRMKNLSLNYRLPESWMKRTRFLQSVNVFAQAENLFTITNFSGFDPEFNGNAYAATYPLARQFTFGVEINL